MADQQTSVLLPCPACGAMSDGNGIPVRRDEISKLREALEAIALCRSTVRGDVVWIAREALRMEHQSYD